MSDIEKSGGIKKSEVGIKFVSRKPATAMKNTLLGGVVGLLSLGSLLGVYISKLRSDEAHHRQIEGLHSIINDQSAYIMEDRLESIAITARGLNSLLNEAEDVVAVIFNREEQGKLYDRIDDLRNSYRTYTEEKNLLIKKGQENGRTYQYPNDQNEFIRIYEVGTELSKEAISIIQDANAVKEQEKRAPKKEGEEKNWSNMVLAERNNLPVDRKIG